MSDKAQERQSAIRHSQNQLLYGGIKFSAAGSLAAAFIIFYTYGSIVDPLLVGNWFIVIISAYLFRLVDFRAFERDSNAAANPKKWGRRFNVGALLASSAWASSMWIIFPADDIAHQLLLVLTLIGVAGGALASLPYDRRLNLAFQLIIVVSVEVRLLTFDDSISYEMALYSLMIFGFQLSCGKEVGKKYFELIRLKQDIQDKNSSVMKTTERMAQIGYWEWDGKAPTIDLSENLAEIWKVDSGSMLAKSCFQKIHVEDRRAVRKSFMKVRDVDDGVVIEYRMATGLERSEYEYRSMRQVIKSDISESGKRQLLGTVQDITDIKSAEAKIYDMAYYDGLTGLANRSCFHEQLSSVISKSRISKKQFSVVYIDLDNFKGVNDSYGHECGDGYLQKFSEHLKNTVRKVDLVARLGGDEFCILVNDIQDISDSIATAKRCLEFSNNIIEVGNHRISPQLSVGISTYPQDGKEPDDIVKSADLAMYYVKNNGKHDFAVYDERMAIETEEQMRLEADLKQALINEEFELWYQPQVNIQENTYSGVEALIRWRHPTRGLVRPDLFITTAERVGMIKEIGEWVLETGCAQLAEWNAQGLYTQLAVNISGEHFIAAGFPEFVDRVVKLHNLNPDHVEIEITESMSRDPVAHTQVCNALQKIGVRIAIDDFGTGYSSLSLLGKMPVNTLKIDKSFIDGVPGDEGSKLMVKSITELCLGFNYNIVAEGVEHAEQLAFLKSLNIPHVQGYHFSKPLPSEEIQPLLMGVDPLRLAA
ncbi:MAG: diguanylate cyclase (GGDEF)-like protein [Patiriisocius sp.]|jgi:diguanylate cyclase (GGDEF)-like protein